ncbi:hypothetical protein FHG87_016210 [Trinorchestia longiramus]|nr:hypothetical protein FHG87_016210 [Trinorchestia longiramus]
MARCMLLEANLTRPLWNYAVRTAAYIRNRCYNPRLQKTPYEALIHAKPNVSTMHKFSIKCHVYVQNRTKLDARSEEGTFIGYDPYSPAYLVYFKKNNTVRRVRCVKFNDKQLPVEENFMKMILYQEEKPIQKRKTLTTPSKRLLQYC